VTDLRVIPVHRDPTYVAWLKATYRDCQLCGTPGMASEFMHPPRRRPWIGKQNGTFSPGKEKASDYGGLHGCKYCHYGIHAGNLVISNRDWNRIALGNLLTYSSTRDPGRDLEAEMLEWVQGEVA